MNPIKTPTRWLGILLAIFGALQMMSEQIKGIVSPSAYGWYTIVVGVALVVLGAIKKGEGSFVMANKTWMIGVAITALGAVQQYSDTFSTLLGPHAFQIFNLVVGIGTAVLGILNAQAKPPQA